MSLFNNDEVKIIAEKCGFKNYDTLQYEIQNYSEELVGYLGEYLRLFLKVNSHDRVLFVKCVPRYDEYKAEYLRKTGFFRKEYVLLSSLFTQFIKREGCSKWRPEVIHLKDEVFVFEDVTKIGYALSDSRKPFSYEEVVATVKAVAKFHADSLIYEYNKTQQLKRPYYIWEDYKEYLFEPVKAQAWRDTGCKGVIDILRIYSAYKDSPNFQSVANVVTDLFNRATKSMQPSRKHRNVVVHRDVWSNNVFFKEMEDGSTHALLVDFQTAVYTIPTHDLATLLFLNTTKKFRSVFTNKMIDIYYMCLSDVLNDAGVNILDFFDKKALSKAYEDSVVFGITQAALVLPIANMPEFIKDKYCRSGNDEFDAISRSHCFIESLESDEQYRETILELFDDIVERFVLPSLNSYK
ncbi:uncharacterized protein LOC125049149 [Pieris napi]|uniref:uncharacterized protein LOC125049149 n=1 Tax=Pieris napi TaxID=78633 RepID=UPI001FB8F308|nr:uncharacterized protein LOC125049149 [Pieris napi]